METCTYEGSEQGCRSLVYGKHTSKARNHAVNNSIDISHLRKPAGEIVFILFINLFFFPAPLWIHPEHIIHILITPALRSLFFSILVFWRTVQGGKKGLWSWNTYSSYSLKSTCWKPHGSQAADSQQDFAEPPGKRVGVNQLTK